MAFPEFQTKEVLNKVLNSGKDALNVDLADSVTVTVDSEFPAAAALQDDSSNPTTTSVGSHLLGYDSSNTNWNRVEVDDAGHLQIDVLSITAGDNNIGNVDIASIAAGDNNIGNVDIASALPAGSNTIGVVDLGSTDNAVLDAIAASLSVLDDWDDTNYANVNMNFAGSDAQAGEGAISATTQRVTIATDDDGVAHLATIAGAVSTQMQVDVVAISAQSDGTYIGDIKFGESLPAGSAAIGKLAANSGVDIGDVDVTSVTTGHAAANLGKREDDAHSNEDVGVMALAVRNDVLEGLSGTDGDYSVLQVNKTGALNVTETVGHLGAHYENGTTARSSMKIVAFQFLEDTKFSVLTPATSAYIGNTSSGGEDVPNDEVFPQGMTIFGRWSAFTLVSGGRVIAYLGDW